MSRSEEALESLKTGFQKYDSVIDALDGLLAEASVLMAETDSLSREISGKILIAKIRDEDIRHGRNMDHRSI